MSTFDIARNIGSKAIRRLQAAHKPVQRLARRHARAQEHRAFGRAAREVEREIAALARGSSPILAGPWLAEVGYEVLYWVPFLRWFSDAFGIPRQRLIVMSRGGMEALYRDVAGGYIDLFEVLSPEALTRRNAARRRADEGGGQKQSATGELDRELLALARTRLGGREPNVCHPSLMFRLFREVWHGNLPLDWLWTHTRYRTGRLEDADPGLPLPHRFAAVKLYSGPALSHDDWTVSAARRVVADVAASMPVITFDTPVGLDEHRDFDLSGIAGVESARAVLGAEHNLARQLAILARADMFVSACGGLGWLAPFIGVPTVAMLDRDDLLAPHLLVARRAGRAAGAAEFATLDLRASRRLTLAPLS